MSEATEREKFEAWFKQKYDETPKHNGDNYLNHIISSLWEGWQAHAALSAAEQVVAPELDREELAQFYIWKSGKQAHSSDCATSCAPAMRPGPCDCNLPQPVAAAPVGVRGAGVGDSAAPSSYRSTPDAEWIAWPGGVQPVSDHAIVGVRLRSGTLDSDRAECWSWRHLGSKYDIVAYRLASRTADNASPGPDEKTPASAP